MAQPIGQKIKSAYAFRRTNGLGHFQPLYVSSMFPINRPNIWKDWWLEQITVNFLTQDLSDSLSSGGTGGSHTFV